jgi:alginate lyase
MVEQTDRKRILLAAGKYLALPPATVAAFPTSKSPGGPHDFFSEADYFWPDPMNPSGPYVSRDGLSYPNIFKDHRSAMIGLSIQMPTLAAAWLVTGDARYVRHAGDHIRAWFITPETRMNPNLEYAQGVHGASTGRSYGIIDSLHLVEVARAATFLGREAVSSQEMEAVKQWFRDYLHWMSTSEKGQQERHALNNHATCWALQASEYARLIGDDSMRSDLQTWFVKTLLPDQVNKDGSFPQELARTKPYSYSIFNFDVMAGLAQSLKESRLDLATYTLPDGRGLCTAANFLYPYIKNKATWPYAKDAQHFDALPVRSPGLLFTGVACHKPSYISLWKTLNPDPSDAEVLRNYPIRQPLLWV